MRITRNHAGLAAAVAAPLLLMSMPGQAATSVPAAGQAPSTVSAAGTSDPPRMQCLYLVKGVEKVAGIYLGEFAVLRRSGSTVRADIGAFQSEFVTFRGSIAGTSLSGRLYEDTDGDGDLESRARTYTWVPASSRIKGWTRVSRATMSKYGGGGVPVNGGICSAVTLSVASRDGFILVDVDPDKGAGYWNLTLQRRTSGGGWATVGVYRTRGSDETRVLAPSPGTYRVKVAGKYGWRGATSPALTVP